MRLEERLLQCEMVEERLALHCDGGAPFFRFGSLRFSVAKQLQSM